MNDLDFSKLAYKPNKEIDKKLKGSNYILDHSLSNRNNKVFVNTKTNEVKQAVAGTNPRSIYDLATDVKLAFSGSNGLKSTDRYKQSKKVFEKTAAKYNNKQNVTGHSLGGSIASKLSQQKKRLLVRSTRGSD